jgi:hypothetical protein
MVMQLRIQHSPVEYERANWEILGNIRARDRGLDLGCSMLGGAKILPLI